MNAAAPVMLATARAVLEREARAVADAAGQLGSTFTDAVSMILATDGMVFVSGIGTSRAVALRLAHLLSCCGTRAVFLHPADAGHGGAGAIAADDIVIVISKGGESGEVNSFAEVARGRGARLIALTERPGSTLARKADVVVHVTAGAGVDPFGMIATGSSLVYSALGDALCVVLLEARGYTRDEFAETHPGGAVGEQIDAIRAVAVTDAYSPTPEAPATSDDRSEVNHRGVAMTQPPLALRTPTESA